MKCGCARILTSSRCITIYRFAAGAVSNPLGDAYDVSQAKCSRMPTEDPKYDVAISFLSKDEAIASAINQKLSAGLEVFFFPRKQEELAGTEGLESMREPFVKDSRVSVVLFREPWGKTPWTRVEETAIKDACFERGWQHLFFVVLDRESALPRWLPQTHVRFNYQDYGLEQAVGAIKALRA